MYSFKVKLVLFFISLNYQFATLHTGIDFIIYYHSFLWFKVERNCIFVADGIFIECNSEKNVSIAWYNRIIIDYSFCLHLVCTHKSEKVKKAFGSSDDKLKATKKQHSIGYFQLQICSNWVRFSIPFMLNWFSFCFTICDANIIKFDKWFTTILYIYFIPKVVLIINSSQNKNNSSFFAFQLLINLIPFPDKASDRL